MRCQSLFLGVVASLMVGVGGSRATEVHLLTVYQALATSPDIEIGPVSYTTWYGGLEETTMEALAWPALLGTPHKEVVKEDLNWASVLGVKTRLAQTPQKRWRFTVDVTGLRAIPEGFREDRLDEDADRSVVLTRILEAAEKNLQALGIYDCEVSLLGEQAHADLKGAQFAAIINKIDDAWGKWRFRSLPRSYPDGDLQQLAARSLVREESLQTIFLILSSETFSAEGKAEVGAFLQELLTRLGDERFAGVLRSSETLVQERVTAALRTPSPHDPNRRIDWPVLFPQTFKLGRADR